MKRLVFVLALLTAFGVTLFAEDPALPKKDTPVFVRHQSAWFYESDWDLGKKANDVKKKKVFTFGNKSIVLSGKKKDNAYFVQVQMPDKSKYWVALDSVTTRFIVTTESDVASYTQPDDSYLTKVKLQPGLLGSFLKEENGFIQVEFPVFNLNAGKASWVGKVWIKAGFSDDVKTAQQAAFINRANNALFGKTPSAELALKELKAGLAMEEETAVTPILKSMVEQLEAAPAPAAEASSAAEGSL